MIDSDDLALPAEHVVRRLANRLAPGARVTDLGGWISRNLRLHSAANTPSSSDAPGTDLVLRVHPAYVSTRRLRAVQRLRNELALRGLVVARPIAYEGSTVLHCDRWLAEVEPYLPNREPARDQASLAWLLHAVGRFHRTAVGVPFRLPAPMHSVYASASTLARWSMVSRQIVRDDPEAAALADRSSAVINRLRRRLPAAGRLPRQLVHGDVKPANIRQRGNAEPVYLDFGFAAYRPRIHDLAFCLTHTILTLDGFVPVDPEDFAWDDLPALIEAYQDGAGWALTNLERNVLAPYTATVRLYWAASVWAHRESSDPPANRLRKQRRAVRLAEWLSAVTDITQCPVRGTPHRPPKQG